VQKKKRKVSPTRLGGKKKEEKKKREKKTTVGPKSLFAQGQKSGWPFYWGEGALLPLGKGK